MSGIETFEQQARAIAPLKASLDCVLFANVTSNSSEAIITTLPIITSSHITFLTYFVHYGNNA